MTYFLLRTYSEKIDSTQLKKYLLIYIYIKLLLIFTTKTLHLFSTFEYAFVCISFPITLEVATAIEAVISHPDLPSGLKGSVS